MIAITPFDQQLHPVVTVKLTEARDAARTALGLVRDCGFRVVKIVNGRGHVAVSKRSEVGTSRLADAIASEATVEFA